MNQASKVAVFAIGAAILLPFVDAMVKLLVRDYSIVLVAWARMGIVALVLGATGGSQVGLKIFKPVAWRLQIARGFAAVLGTAMVFLGFRALPLAECTAIVFLAPVLANLFSQYGLKERGDRFSWAIALASFVGVLAIAKPGSALFTPAAIYPLIGAVGLALFMTLTRAVSAHDHPRVTAFFGPFVTFLVFSLALPWYGSIAASWFDLGMFLAIGGLAAIAGLLQTHAYRHGTTHQVAPFGYASLVIALLLGWAVFGAMPDAWSMFGMAIIVMAGIAMVLRAD